MHSAKKGRFVFFITLIISFIILSSVFLVVLIISKVDTANVEQQEVPYIAEYNPSREENLALILIGCEAPQSLPDMVALIYYDAPLGIIYSLAVPSTTVSEVNGRTDTLKGHYEYSGNHGCMSGLKSALKIEIDRYCRFQKQGIENMVDFLGGIPYKVESDKTIGNERLIAGEQLLDGRRTAGLLFSKTIGQACDNALQTELITKLLLESFDDSLAQNYDGLVSTFFYNCETNMNQYDFAKRQTGFLKSLNSDTLVIEELEVSGSYNLDKTEFYISDESIKKIEEIVNPIIKNST